MYHIDSLLLLFVFLCFKLPGVSRLHFLLFLSSFVFFILNLMTIVA